MLAGWKLDERAEVKLETLPPINWPLTEGEDDIRCSSFGTTSFSSTPSSSFTTASFGGDWARQCMAWTVRLCSRSSRISAVARSE